MIQQIFLGLWVCMATLLGIYGADIIFGESGNAKGAHVSGLTYVSTEPITVPVLLNGQIEGYAIAKFVYGVPADKLKKHQERIAVQFADSVFREMYNEEPLRVARKDRQDLDMIVAKIKRRSNKVIGNDVVKEVLIDFFNYVPSDQVRCGKRAPSYK